jgi:hypothetical protein
MLDSAQYATDAASVFLPMMIYGNDVQRVQRVQREMKRVAVGFPSTLVVPCYRLRPAAGELDTVRGGHISECIQNTPHQVSVY